MWCFIESKFLGYCRSLLVVPGHNFKNSTKGADASGEFS